MWTKDDLQKLVREKMGDYLFVVVSNRQPYAHVFNRRSIQCQRGIGGVISALDPVMQACQGLWVALSDGDADQKVSAADGKIKVLLHLLSPARRPVQITNDLASFWNDAYFQVKKDLKARYPKHYWPDNPLEVQACRGIKRR